MPFPVVPSVIEETRHGILVDYPLAFDYFNSQDSFGIIGSDRISGTLSYHRSGRIRDGDSMAVG
jgi:hypothetical protein